MADRYWTVEILFNAFTPSKKVVWDIIERFRWSQKVLDEEENDDMKRVIAREVRAVYNPPAFRMWPSTDEEILSAEKSDNKVAVEIKST